MTLIAVILAATHQGKQQIVFAYPPNPAALPRTSRPHYGRTFALADRTGGHDEDEETEQARQGYGAPVAHPDDELPEGQGTPPTFGENSWLIKDKRRDPQSDPVFEYLGFNADVLAEALLPNHAKLYNEKFELVINHLAFVGHPVHLDSVRTKQDATSAVSPVTSTDQSVASLDSFVFPPNSTMHHGEDASLHRANSAKGGSYEPEVKLDRFNLVLVVDTPPDKHLSRQLDIYYKDIVIKMTAALKGEERRSNWISTEARRCRKIKSDFKPDQVEALTNRMMSQSTLCRAIADIYDAVTENRVAHLEALNGNLDVSLLLHNELLDDKPLEGYRDAGIVDDFDPSLPTFNQAEPAFATVGTAKIAKWHALLPLQEPAEMLDELETGLVAEFVSMLTPRLNLAEYEMLLDVELDTIYQIAQHLIYWRKARIISVLNLQGVVSPRSDFKMKRLPALSRDFAVTFPSLGNLPSLLSILSSPTPFKKALPPGTDRSVAFDSLVWLLRHDLVVQLHVFARIVATPTIRRAAQRAASFASSPVATGVAPASSPDLPLSGKTPDSLKGVDDDGDRDDRASSVINEPSRPSPLERRWLEQILVGKPPTEVDHFQRMMPFLNGRHHLDSVAMQTSLSRREIRDVLDVFSAEIVTFMSESDQIHSVSIPEVMLIAQRYKYCSKARGVCSQSVRSEHADQGEERTRRTQ